MLKIKIFIIIHCRNIVCLKDIVLTYQKNYYNFIEYSTTKRIHYYKKFNKVLEIGIGGHDLEYQVGSSLLALNYFFNKSKIYGLDLMNKEFLNTKRITTFIASQNDEKELERIVKK